MTRQPHLAATLALASLVVVGCGGHGQQAAPPPPAGDRFVVAEQWIDDVKPVAATLTSKKVTDARARIGGTLASLSVKEGDLVRRGEVIGRVTDERIGLETEAYGAQVGAAQAEYTRAEADLARTQDLYEHGVYAKARLDQVEAAARAAAGALGAARAQRAASAEAGAQGAIVAPADGQVLQVEIPAGTVVMPGQSVATLTAGETVIRIEAPEADMRALRVGQTLAVASDDGAPVAASAVVTQIYPGVAAGQVTADLSAPGLKAQFVGQRVRVSLPVGRRRAVVIPSRLIVTRYGVDYVRVIGKGGAASDTPVQTAQSAGGSSVEILSGVGPGDVLVSPVPGT